MLCSTKYVVRPSEVLPEQRVDIEHSPDTTEVLQMLNDLRTIYRHHRQLACVIGVPVATLRRWLAGQHHPPRASARGIWVIHCLHFAPWKLRTSFDLITWGRYARKPKGEEPPKHGG